MIAIILIALVAFWLVHNAFEDSKGTALLPYRTVATQPFVHQPDLPEHEQLASQSPEQPPGVLDTTRVAYDLGIPAERLARPWPGYLMGPASDLGWLGAVVDG
jgi:hypothetical protein